MKDFVDKYMIYQWGVIGIDKPDNHDSIVKFIVEDVKETADSVDWHSGDVDIAFRRWIESQIKDLDF